MPYLIDGHNLIPKLGLRLDSPDDEMQLVEILQEFLRLQRREAEVYFDGAPAGRARSQKLGAVTAHFVRLGLSADSAIRARLEEMRGEARNWIVVSSDRQVQSAARAAHAGVTSSDQFAGLLRGTRPSSPGRSELNQLSPEEIEEWLKLFRKEE
jgi:uncharacterized protein